MAPLSFWDFREKFIFDFARMAAKMDPHKDPLLWIPACCLCLYWRHVSLSRFFALRPTFFLLFLAREVPKKVTIYQLKLLFVRMKNSPACSNCAVKTPVSDNEIMFPETTKALPESLRNSARKIIWITWNSVWIKNIFTQFAIIAETQRPQSDETCQ